MGKTLSINPIARAVAVIAAVAGLTTAMTMALVTSNTVALTPNEITTAAASLVIDNNDSCANNSPTSVTGFQVTALAPGSEATKEFCLRNIGDVSLDISASIPQNLNSSTAATETDLTIACDTIGTVGPIKLNLWGSPQAFTTAPLATAVNEDCTATVKLSDTYSGQGGEAIPAFTINFNGTQPDIE